MKPTLIQTTRPEDTNRGEITMLRFLERLPDASYWVYRELSIAITKHFEKRPDFVVVSPDLGIIVIECKDWNLDGNDYVWRDQEMILKYPRGNRSVQPDEIRNPLLQVVAYKRAFENLLGPYRLSVTSLLAFPMLSRQQFLNRLENVALLQNPQSRFLINLEAVIFNGDLGSNLSHPQRLLLELARKTPEFHGSTPDLMPVIHERLLPRSFVIGSYQKVQDSRQRLKTLSERQQKWVFQLDQQANYLLDVPGSGKTNTLISRALYLVDRTSPSGITPRILLTTYNENLARNIQRIFHDKVGDETARYQCIEIHSIPTLMEYIICQGYNLPDLSSYQKAGETRAAYELRLRADVQEILEADKMRFKLFDHVLIDEIQDFDDLYLQIVRSWCKTGSFFMVGDVGQKLYPRQYDLNRLSITIEKITLEKSFRMYRTPKSIGDLAVQFIMRDSNIRSHLKIRGRKNPVG